MKGMISTEGQSTERHLSGPSLCSQSVRLSEEEKRKADCCGGGSLALNYMSA